VYHMEMRVLVQKKCVPLTRPRSTLTPIELWHRTIKNEWRITCNRTARIP
jgi:hypothetical protein